MPATEARRPLRELEAEGLAAEAIGLLCGGDHAAGLPRDRSSRVLGPTDPQGQMDRLFGAASAICRPRQAAEHLAGLSSREAARAIGHA